MEDSCHEKRPGVIVMNLGGKWERLNYRKDMAPPKPENETKIFMC